MIRIVNFPNLTLNQIYALTEGKKHWSEKKNHLIKLAKSFGIHITDDGELQYLIEVHCPKEQKRIQWKLNEDVRTGKRRTNLTPTDIKGDFGKVENPIIGRPYHISWAYSGAVFILKKIEGETCFLDNPKNKRSILIKCNLSELRLTRNGS